MGLNLDCTQIENFRKYWLADIGSSQFPRKDVGVPIWLMLTSLQSGGCTYLEHTCLEAGDSEVRIWAAFAPKEPQKKKFMR